MTESRGAAQPVIITGLRGMGKTVLLRRTVREAGPSAIVLAAEGSESKSLGPAFRRSLERAQAELITAPERLRSTIGRVIERLPKASFEFPHDMGAIAIEGHNEKAVPKPFVDALYELNETAGKHGRFLILAIDEIQLLAPEDLVPIVEFIHETAGTTYPALLIAAGLPNSKPHLHRVKTYSERWRYFRLELLNAIDTRNALAIPLRERDVAIDDEALEILAHESAGYPFFVQEYGSAAWSVTDEQRITTHAIRTAVPGVRKLLDSSLYEPAFDALTAPELRYAFALARLGPGPHRVSDVAKAQDASADRINWIRNQLLKKDIIYVPAGGLVEFRLPLTDQFLLRNKDALSNRFPD